MKLIKGLWSVGLAMAVVIVYAAVCSYLVDVGPWYDALIKPRFTGGAGVMSAGWCLCYAADIAVLARMLMTGRRGYPLILALIRGLLNILWCALFFRVHTLFVSAGVVFVMLLYTAVMLFGVRKDGWTALLLLAESAWLAYLATVMLNVAFLNL